MSFNFVCDRLINGRAYPALATWPAEPYTQAWQEFGQHYPYTVPVDLYEHCSVHQVPVTVHELDSAWPTGSYYPIAVQFFNFDIDYIDLLSATVKNHVQAKRLTLLFYYDEGDNPVKIKQRLDHLCIAHAIPLAGYHFISSNSASQGLPRFHYFLDAELLYWHRNRVEPTPIHTQPRSRQFTVLSRTHKWWRATVMSDLHRNCVLENSYWSYNTKIDINDHPKDNPIEVDTLGLRDYMTEFLTAGPYTCDDLSAEQHNNHACIETAHYNDSYCNIVLETHFDADQSGGTFLTEKTFKPIKHGQPFVIVGPAGSLARLREAGYRTFDHAIDNTYDTIVDNTARWQAVLKTIQQIQHQDLQAWFNLCLEDVIHNQQLFCTSKTQRLNTLLERLR
jgi:hypothetical protein